MVAIRQIAARHSTLRVATWRVLPSSDPNPGHWRSIRVPRGAPEAIARARYAQGNPSIAVEISALDLGARRSNRRLQGGWRAPVRHLPAMSEGDKCGHIVTDTEVARLDAPGTNDRAQTTQQVAGRAEITWVALAQH